MGSGNVITKRDKQGLGSTRSLFSEFPAFKSSLSYLAYKLFIKPRSTDEDSRRRESILNYLLVGTLILTTTASMRVVIDYLKYGEAYHGAPPYLLFFAFSIFFGLYVLSRIRFYRLAAYIFILLYFSLATYTIYKWGVGPPQGLLIYALVIVAASVLVGTRLAIVVTIGIDIVLIGLTYLYQIGRVHPDTYWANSVGKMEDTIVYVVTLGVILIVSWLSNREIERSLNRAHASELALKEERDLLEVKVEERTRELRKAQQEEILQLYRFAELGKMTSSLIHDLVNPLTTVSLNLEQLGGKQKPDIVKRAKDAAKRMENFIETARLQVHQQRTHSFFMADQIISQAIEDTIARAKANNVAVDFIAKATVEIYGNPARFHQVILNLLCNAIDSYESKVIKGNKRDVTIELYKDKRTAYITVRDLGRGIPEEIRAKIFEPFFSTKSKDRGLGLGLSITKDIFEKDFSGTITVATQEGKGTSFLLSFPIK